MNTKKQYRELKEDIANYGSFLTSLVEYFGNDFEVKGNIYEPNKSI